MSKELIYVASPYTHHDPVIMELRYRYVEIYVSECLKAGETIFSPIVHSHHMAKNLILPTDHEFWQTINHRYMDICASMRVLKLDGWDHSFGVADEIEYANKINLPYTLIEHPIPHLRVKLRAEVKK